MAKPTLEMTIERVRMDLPDTKTLRLTWPDGYDPQFKTGQFITLHWPEATDYKRAYSLCSCALDRGYFDVTVKREGKMGTRIVDWARVGDKLWVLPPAGKFLPVYEPDTHLVCIAGGSGVTPFRAFARESTLRGLTTRITILYSVRHPGEIIFQDEFRQLEAANPQFRLLVTCTRLAQEQPWEGRRGRIDPGWIGAQVEDLAKTVFYACGSQGLVDAAEEMVVRHLGASKAQMKTEKWW
ncbi:MAG: hypothetical protein FJ387_02755 [Verrucomicrobia bacterium]|nr:hypothetical protein [Verrucomicrobiota bacterium]